MSDLHGEYEAFLHILNSASGAVREKVDALFENVMSRDDRARLATLIYYPCLLYTSCDKDADLAGTEPGHNLVALGLAHVAVEAIGIEAAFTQQIAQACG